MRKAGKALIPVCLTILSITIAAGCRQQREQPTEEQARQEQPTEEQARQRQEQQRQEQARQEQQRQEEQRIGERQPTGGRVQQLPQSLCAKWENQIWKVQDDTLVREIQTNLKQKGFYQGEVNGKADNQTIQAVADFQRRQGIEATGMLDQRTTEQLGVSFGRIQQEQQKTGQVGKIPDECRTEQQQR